MSANSFFIPPSSLSTKQFSQGSCLHPARPVLQHAQKVTKHNIQFLVVSSQFLNQEVIRRSGNYKPSSWDYDGLQSLKSEFLEEAFVERAKKLMVDVKRKLNQAAGAVDQLELIDTLQRLGVGYHFQSDIKSVLESIKDTEEELYAQQFTYRHLIKQLKEKTFPNYKNMARLVSHALEMPLHWRMKRWEARWFIDTYSMKQDVDPLILEFAKLDFNMVQAIYQQELKDASRWWTDLGLAEALRFSRDRIAESYLWTTGVIFEPQFGYCRRQLTKVNCLITTIDDVYGTLDELKLFTDTVERWDINRMGDLPDYMKMCFMALYNSINEMAYDVLKKSGRDILKYLKKGDELKRGDVPKSIQCYMRETGAPEEIAREHIRGLRAKEWKKMNKCMPAPSPFPRAFKDSAIDLGRMAQFMYQHGDGHGVLADCLTRNNIMSLLVNPIPLDKL
ncbi:PREDICTED: (-)-alpha-terpineol synthase-like [Nelumbo nucifera]|uniref:(-)-alpha-terpineol synthase-like n=1 Tax=Nelumbo nucifera TaxID=4432 RepID=A0A1U7ZE50_NELNU|nr:PREDICTED: (-)-alpha-terpineol synthase-like [Nelumbo nucifera]